MSAHESIKFARISSNASYSRSLAIALFVLISLFLTACFQRGIELEEETTTRYMGFTNFETEPVHPLVITTDQRYLYALNTADDRLEVFKLVNGQPQSIGESLVGLRPVAITLTSDNKAWIVNHLSDSVSVVDLTIPSQPTVIQTIQVGDEPRGIVVAGRTHPRVFVACARRDESLTPGIGRAEVWVLDPQNLDGKPQIITLFGTKPRALAVSENEKYVYATIFHSGNKTTSVSGEEAERLGRISKDGPYTLFRYGKLPKAGAIVAESDGRWQDSKGQDWSEAIAFELPDNDVFIIDTERPKPRLTGTISGVGTVLFDIAEQPGTGELWVTNTNARNLTILEPALNSQFASNRITRIHPGPSETWNVSAVDLNPHIDRKKVTGNTKERELSLAQPTSILFHPDGNEAYVAAFGSGKIGVVNSSGNVIDRIDTGFGPGGLAIASQRNTLYVLNHLDSTISTIDLTTRTLLSTTPLKHNPTPDAIKAGRPFLYDASITSGHGDLSCATCHVFSDFDGVAWDLGNPKGEKEKIPRKISHQEEKVKPRQLYHPLKGPMMTQSLRGLAHSAPYHWRGDKFGEESHPSQDIASFVTFNPTYVNLLGRSQIISSQHMEDFARFAMTIHYPPNPNQRLDRTFSESAQEGFEFYTGTFLSDQHTLNCEECHALPTGSNNKVNFEGFQVGRDMKAAHLRNVYQKVGRFNVTGPQVSGYGLLHDGHMDTIPNFLRLDVFVFPGATKEEQDQVRHQLHDYIMEFDTGMAPVVGKQVTLNKAVPEIDRQLLGTLIARADKGDCDLIAYTRKQEQQKSWLYQNGAFTPDAARGKSLSYGDLTLLYSSTHKPLSFLCVPPGDGIRTALDRDLDGIRNGDESSSFLSTFTQIEQN
ncbi:MAG: hypothetical protein QNJ17_00110 [Desulfocapsaceae bacterium]|nr:hypothetical protein [Desulfocapsaceae bacterium]